MSVINLDLSSLSLYKNGSEEKPILCSLFDLFAHTFAWLSNSYDFNRCRWLLKVFNYLV